MSLCLVSANTSMFVASYSSALTTANERYAANYNYSTPWFYYEAILLNITVSGSYRIFSRSTVDAYGYLYAEMFDPRLPLNMLIEVVYPDPGDDQFLIENQLVAGRVYIVVVTTSEMNMTGPFTIVAFGPGPITLTRLNVTGKAINTVFESSCSITRAISSLLSSIPSTHRGN